MNRYRQTLKYLYDLQYSGIKLGLRNIRQLLDAMGNPQQRFPAIHIAGTNGKGSTAAFLFRVLKEAGYRVGLYTSPHLVDFNERIRVNDQLIPWGVIGDYTDDLRPAIEAIKPTFFEATSAIAFRYFAEQQVDVAVVETGLGGRLDATNLVRPLLTLVTSVGLEHQQYLGDTLEQIAAEKAGILKAGIPCLTTNTDPRVLTVLRERARTLKSPLVVLDADRHLQVREETITGARFDLNADGLSLPGIEITMAGSHQIENAALAALALKKLPGWAVPNDVLYRGLRNAFWPARLQLLRREPPVFLDVAHNPPGFSRIRQFLRKHFPAAKATIILGLAKDKDFAKVAGILADFANEVVLVARFSERQLPAEKLKSALAARGVPVRIYPEVDIAYRETLNQLTAKDILLITGSHYLAGRFMEKLHLT